MICWTPSSKLRTKLFVVWGTVFSHSPSKLSPLVQITCQRFTWIPQALTLQLPITHRLKAQWSLESFCSHLVPSMKLSPRLTMNSFSTALHMCLHNMSPGGGRQKKEFLFQKGTWLTIKQREEDKTIWQEEYPVFMWKLNRWNGLLTSKYTQVHEHSSSQRSHIYVFPYLWQSQQQKSRYKRMVLLQRDTVALNLLPHTVQP